MILTPHPGEAARFLRYCGEDISGADRLRVAELLVRHSGAICVLKGSKTLVATRDGNSYINTTGNPGMATGGSGDVLTGIIAALAGQGHSPETCAKAGVFLHGMAGDLCAESLGETGMTSLDLANMTEYFQIPELSQNYMAIPLIPSMEETIADETGQCPKRISRHIRPIWKNIRLPWKLI